MRKITILLACILFAFQAVLAQRTITGTVVSSEDGSGLPGVTVVVQGTTVGTTTDMAGKYQLTVPVNARILEFSFIGMKRVEVAIGDQVVINVTMDPDVVDIEGVVVTALGIERERRSIGYSLQEIGDDVIGKTGNPNLVTALQGKVAGMEVRQSSGMPGAAATILIRGARSFSGNNQPLVVIDGMPIRSTPDIFANVIGTQYTQRLLDIDPNDIENITVLKGQAAAALYGMEAFNGVLVITTRSGRGLAVGRPVVSVTTNYSQDRVSRWPDLQQTYAQGTADFGSGKFAFRPVHSLSWGPRIDSLPNDPVYGGNNFPVIVGGDTTFPYQGMFFHPQKAAWVLPQAFNSTKDFFETGHTVNTNINVSQNTHLGDYTLGFGTTTQEGIIPSSAMTRHNARIGANLDLNTRWKAGFQANYADLSVDKIPSGNSGILFTVYGSPPSYDLAGTPYHAPGNPFDQFSYRRGAVGENPIWATKNNIFNEATRRFFGHSYLQFMPTTWANFRYQLGVDYYGTDMEEILQMGSTQAGHILRTAAGYATPLNPVPAPVIPTGGQIINQGIIHRNVNSLLLGTFNHDFSEDLSATLILGNEIVDQYRRTWWMQGTTFTQAGWNNMANTSTQTASETKNYYRSFGVFGNLELEYMGMLYLNLTGRNDIVSSMPRGSRSFFYPSVSLGFVFTELEALRDNNLLPFGKLRASFAQVGQAGSYFDPYFLRSDAGTSGFQIWGVLFPIGGATGYQPSSRLWDPNLQPENTNSVEVGADLRFLNNRIGLDYTYVYNVADGQIFPVPMAGSTGFVDIFRNAGRMLTKGHELMLTTTPLLAGDFRWDVNVNFTRLVNTVEELAEGVDNIFLGGYVDPNIRAAAGDTYPAIYGTQFLRDAEGRILVDENPESDYYGFPLAGDFGKIGDVSPDFLMGINTMIRYKYVTLSAFFDWKQGGQIYSGTNRLIDFYGTSALTEDRERRGVLFPDGYLSNGQPNNIERGGPDDPFAHYFLHADLLSNISEAHIFDASFFRLRDVSLGIALPKRLISPLRLQTANITLSARNILLWAPMLNFDPETSQASGNAQGGFDYMSLPQASSFGLGVNFTF